VIKQFLNELRHRRVLRTAAAYAVVTAAVVEFTDIVTPALSLPEGLLGGVISFLTLPPRGLSAGHQHRNR
jgi:hypothetical protein